MHLNLLCALMAILVGSADTFARDQKAVHAFRATHPCPATNETSGRCQGWVVDHIKPLCAGGADAPANMQWQPYPQAKHKDKIEINFCRCMARQLAPCVIFPIP